MKEQITCKSFMMVIITIFCVLWLSEQNSFIPRGCNSSVIPYLWQSHSFRFGVCAGIRYLCNIEL